MHSKSNLIKIRKSSSLEITDFIDGNILNDKYDYYKNKIDGINECLNDFFQINIIQDSKNDDKYEFLDIITTIFSEVKDQINYDFSIISKFIKNKEKVIDDHSVNISEMKHKVSTLNEDNINLSIENAHLQSLAESLQKEVEDIKESKFKFEANSLKIIDNLKDESIHLKDYINELNNKLLLEEKRNDDINIKLRKEIEKLSLDYKSILKINQDIENENMTLKHEIKDLIIKENKKESQIISSKKYRRLQNEELKKSKSLSKLPNLSINYNTQENNIRKSNLCLDNVVSNTNNYPTDENLKSFPIDNKYLSLKYKTENNYYSNDNYKNDHIQLNTLYDENDDNSNSLFINDKERNSQGKENLCISFNYNSNLSLKISSFELCFLSNKSEIIFFYKIFDYCRIVSTIPDYFILLNKDRLYRKAVENRIPFYKYIDYIFDELKLQISRMNIDLNEKTIKDKVKTTVTSTNTNESKYYSTYNNIFL